ncbi:protein transport protein Sec31A [Rhopalosiphum maidis]|uniref:protein transport protein Sec31A n=1 Tax=Rhopalosiphum maidis TaxID=43146 RepID=UPI000F00EF4A|nr:protein transport protein Sec31A [Rhopalosiphum maidis]
MKIKEFQKTVVSTWSPKSNYPINIAMGTAAQQLDASFNTSSTLELYTVQSNDITLNASISTDCRFHKLVWGGANNNEEWDSGIIAAGCDNGVICLYNASKLARNVDSILAKSDRHVGSVKALNFNLFQTNLFASGASESEIFIWDLNSMSTPMTPGSKSETLEDVIDLAWNNEVQHILGSLFHKYTVVWDLRKNEPIIKLSDSNSKVKWKAMSWNPKVATQVCIASEDDQNPVIQLWDLRYASSPVKNLMGHQKGILSMSWCSEDPDLLISCGKDNRLLIWNPSSENDENLLVCDLEHNNQWNFEINWCPKDPLLIATSSFDGLTTVYSINDLQNFDDRKISSQNENINSQWTTASNLTNAPKWLQRNCGASFAFGGYLVSFDGSLKAVQLNKTVIESDLLVWSDHLSKILNNGNFEGFCHNKSELTSDDNLQLVWKFLKTMFQNNPKEAQLEILGYSTKKEENEGFHSNLSNIQEENNIVAKFDDFNLKSSNADELQDLIYQSLLIGNLSTAADLFLDSGKPVEALLLAIIAGPKTLSRIQNKYLKNSKEPTAALIHAIVTNDWSNLIENCNLNCWKEIMTAILTHTNGLNFISSFEKLGNRLAASDDQSLSKYAQLCYICSGNVEALIDNKKDIKTIEKLQECVEMAMMLHQSKLSSKSNLEVGQKLSGLLVMYSEILISQGDLEGALTYLEFTNKDYNIELKNQLYKALGKNQTAEYSNNVSQKTFNIGTQDLRKYSTSSATGTVTPEPPFPSYPNKFIQDNEIHQNHRQLPSSYPPNIQSQPIYNILNQPTPIYNNHLNSTPEYGNSYINQTNVQKTVPPTPPPDSSNRCMTPSSIKPGKPKYVVDPSVKGNNVYGSYNNGLRTPSMTNTLGQQSGFNAQMGQPHTLNPPFIQQSGFNSPMGQPLPHTLNQPFGQQSNFNQPIGQSNTLNQPLGQQSGFNPPMGQSNFINQPLGHTSNLNEQLNQPSQPNIYNPASAQISNFNQPKSFGQLPNMNQQQTFQPIQSHLNNFSQAIPPSPNFNQSSSTYNQSTPSVEPLPMNYMKKSTPGWNDPPMLSTSAPIQKPPTPVSSIPITHPLYTNNPPPIEEIGTYIPLQSNNEEQYSNNITQGVEALTKQPIPQEHVKIQVVLEGLQSKLLEAAPTAQTRKKVLDISKKLELLYDSLRENSLSAYLIQCLHTMIDLVLKRDYNGAFNIHTQLVSGPEFSKISTFMPSLKALFQMTYQYNVSLEGL